MGFVLDVACACALSFMLFMLTFLWLGNSVPASALLSLTAAACVAVIAYRLLKKKSKLTRRRKRLLSDKYVKSLCYMDAADAHSETFKLLSGKYPLSDEVYEDGRMLFTHAKKERAVLVILQKLKTSPDDLLAAWRTKGRGSGASSMVVCVPGRSEQDIRVTAARLKDPSVIVLDRRQLRSLARKYAPLKERDTKKPRAFSLYALSAFVTRRRAGRYLLYALILNVYYIVTGSLIYLAASVALIAAAAIGVRKQAEPERLL